MPTSSTEKVVVTVRMDPSLRAHLREVYWSTVGEHHLSFNAWLCKKLKAIK